MKILHLSDTHGYHRRLQASPEADIVIHSGDFCMPHLFGHIHSSHGIETINGITFSNGTILYSDYIQHYYPNVLTIN